MTDDETHVVTGFLGNDGRILLCRRSDRVGAYAGKWDGVSEFADGDPDEQVSVELREEIGFDRDAVDLLRRGGTVDVVDDELDRHWAIHPYLFDAERREVALSEAHDAHEWVPATEILRRDCVPGLWRAYERVAPSVHSVAADDEHGAAYLSVRALEVLRDRAGVLCTADASPAAAFEEVADLARRLRRARPSMAVLENRVNRALAIADRTPAGPESAAMDAVNRAVRVDAEAADRAAALVGDRSVLTLSRSGTVLRALEEADPTAVFVAESRPDREGVGLAEALVEGGPVTLHTDAAMGQVLAGEDVDCVLVGADSVLPDGRIVNKTGTRLAAVAAAHEEVPVFVACASDKVQADDDVTLESGRRLAVYDGDVALEVRNPTFDVTPPHLVDAIVTERGELDPGEVEAVANEHASLATWDEGDASGDDETKRGHPGGDDETRGRQAGDDGETRGGRDVGGAGGDGAGR